MLRGALILNNIALRHDIHTKVPNDFLKKRVGQTFQRTKLTYIFIAQCYLI